MSYVLTGGFAKGYRTYIMTGLAALTVAAGWAVGDHSTAESVRALWEIFMAGGVAAARAAM